MSLAPTPTTAPTTTPAPAPRRGRAGQRLLDGLLLSPVLLLAGWCCWAIATQDRLLWVDLIFDDAYYYLGIARNVAEHGSSSFLPPFETNGYQPLWLLLLAGAARLFGSGERALAIELVALTAGFVLLFALLSRRWHGRLWPALLVCVGFPVVTMAGLETVMLPVLVLGLFRSQRWASRGGFAAALFLARLDALALVVMRDAWRLVVKRERPAAFKHWLILAPVMGLYFGLNWFWFGTPIPVSGQAKAVGNALGENLLPLLLYANAAKFVLVLVAVLFGLQRVGRGVLALRYAEEIAVLLLTLAACTAYYSLMSGWSVWEWYFWPAMLLGYYALLEALNLLPQARRAGLAPGWRLLLGAALALLLLSLLRVGAGVLKGQFRLVREVAHQQVEQWSFGRKNVQWVEALHRGAVPRGAMLAMGDRAGSFGYFLGNGYGFVHTEGLVGPYAYVRSMRADAGGSFLQTVGVDYLVVDREHYFDNGQVVGIAEPVQGLSVHVGPSLHCFGHAAVLSREKYAGQTRLLIDFRQRAICPREFQQAFDALRSSYGGLRAFSLPGEYARGGPLYPLRWLAH